MSDTDRADGASSVSAEDLHEIVEREREKNRKLSEQLQSEQSARSRAEQERDNALGSAVAEVDRRWAAEEEKLEAQASAASGEAEALEQQIASLNAEGSFAEAAKAARRMARAEATLAHVEQQKQMLTEAKEFQKNQAITQQQQRARQAAGPDLSNYSARERRWIQEHPEFLTSAKFRAKVFLAHEEAKELGYERDTNDYFSVLNEAVEDTGRGRRREAPGEREGERRGDGGRNGQYDREPAPRQRAAPEDMGYDDEEYTQAAAAPVTRRAQSYDGQPRQSVRLSADEREAADISMPDRPINDWMENGVLQPGRYKRYRELQIKLRQQGRLS